MDGLKATEPAEEEGEGVGGKRENKANDSFSAEKIWVAK